MECGNDSHIEAQVNKDLSIESSELADARELGINVSSAAEKGAAS